MLLPVSGVFAYPNSEITSISKILDTTSFNSNSYDDDLSTYESERANYNWELNFKEAQNELYLILTVPDYYNENYYSINFIAHHNGTLSSFRASPISHELNKTDSSLRDFKYDFTHFENLISIDINFIYTAYRIHEIGFISDKSNYDDVSPSEIVNFNKNQTDLQVNFSYELPNDEDFSHVKIYQDNVLIADNVTDTSYTVDNLDYGGTYNFKFTTVDTNGNESEGVIETVTIAMPELEEIQQVNAEASHDRIDLSWSLPETEYFEHVNIYRKSVSEVQTFNLLSVDEYDPLFETNGTYFNDLTVEEQTTYDYKLTTEFQGLESQGVTVQATTLAAPPPELGGQEFIEQENGDYLVTWQQPETGQVRILVDGQEYVVVPATDKQYTIPAADMKYSALGDPLVGLQTIGDNGEESEVEQQVSNVNLPFGINELLTTSAGLLRVIGSLILLGLSFILVPKFIKVIKQSLNNKKNAETERTERQQRVSERAYREPRESRISTREARTSTRVPREFRKGE